MNRKNKHLCQTWQDFDDLHSLCVIFDPLNEFIASLCSEDSVTFLAIKPALSVLKNSILAPRQNVRSILALDRTSEIKKKVLEHMEGKYDIEDISKYHI